MIAAFLSSLFFLVGLLIWSGAFSKTMRRAGLHDAGIRILGLGVMVVGGTGLAGVFHLVEDRIGISAVHQARVVRDILAVLFFVIGVSFIRADESRLWGSARIEGRSRWLVGILCIVVAVLSSSIAEYAPDIKRFFPYMIDLNALGQDMDFSGVGFICFIWIVVLAIIWLTATFGSEHSMALTGLFFVCVGFILPFAWMVSTSLKETTKVMDYPPHWVPESAQYSNYVKVATETKFQPKQYSRNTVIVATLSVIGNCLASSLVAYGFAKIKFKGRGVLFAIMLSTMMIPFPVTMVSNFRIFRWMADHHLGQWIGTYKPLWVPMWLSSAFSIFLLRQFFMTIPEELSEAARIDGCSELGIFVRIIIPLARPAITVVALFTFMAAWNDFLGPLLYIQDQTQQTLSLALQQLQAQHGMTPYNLLMAASIIVITPVLVLFFLAQKTFIEGIATTGMKG